MAQSSQKVLVYAIAILAGLAIGFVWSLSLRMGLLAGSSDTYPLRLTLPNPDSLGTISEIVESSTDRLAGGSGEVPTPIQGQVQPDVLGNSGDQALVQSRAPELGPGGVLALDYDLGQSGAATTGHGGSDGSVETSLPLFVDGVSRGAAMIRIAGNAQILISTGDVASAVGERRDRLSPRLADALEAGDGFLPFHELRAAGISVEYDPVRDRISLSLPS